MDSRLAKPPLWWPGINLQHRLARELVGCWPFGDGSGLRLSDLSTGDNPGTLTNMDPVVDWTSRGLHFDGSGSHVLTGLSTPFWDFTVIVLFRASGAVGGEPYARLVDQTYATGFWIGKNNEDETQWGGGVRQSSFPYGRFITLSFGDWHQIVSRRELFGNSGKHFIIGDGGRVSKNAVVVGTQMNVDLVTFGKETASSSHFEGEIGQVLIYNRALADQEIMELYADPWKFMRPPKVFYLLTASVYTATANNLPIGGITLSSSAISTVSTFTATADNLLVGGETFVASATFTAPIYSATANNLLIGGAIHTSSATSTEPISTATADNLPVGSTASASSATFVAPVFSATANGLPVGGISSSSSVTSEPTFIATANGLPVSKTTLTSSATFVAPIFDATANGLPVGGVSSSSSATSVSPTANGNIDFYTQGHIQPTGIVSFYSQGHIQTTGVLDFYSLGINHTTQNFNIYTLGPLVATTGLDFYTLGHIESTGNLNVYTAGYIQPTGHLRFHTWGHVEQDASFSFFTGSAGREISSFGIYSVGGSLGGQSSDSEMPFFIRGQVADQKDRTMPIYMQGRNGFFYTKFDGEPEYTEDHTIFLNSSGPSLPIFLDALDDLNESFNIYTKGKTEGAGEGLTSSLTFFASVPLVGTDIVDLGSSLTAEMPIYVERPFGEALSFYSFAAGIASSGELSFYTLGELKNEERWDIYTQGAYIIVPGAPGDSGRKISIYSLSHASANAEMSFYTYAASPETISMFTIGRSITSQSFDIYSKGNLAASNQIVIFASGIAKSTHSASIFTMGYLPDPGVP